MKRSFVAGLAALALATVPAACGPAPHPAAPAPAPHPAAPAAHAPAAPPSDVEVVHWKRGDQPMTSEVPRVVLLDPGAAAGRAPLRIATSARGFQLHVRLVGETRHKTGTTPADASAVDAIVEVMGAAQMPGVVALGCKVASARVTSRAKGMGHGIEILDRARGSLFLLILSTRGQLLAVATKPTATDDGTAAGVLGEAIAEAIAVPLPVEPVGIGARWRIRRAAQLTSGMTLAALEEVTYTLQRRDGGLLQIGATSRRVPLFDGKRPLSISAADASLVKRAMMAAAPRSIEALGRGVDPTARGEMIMAFQSQAPQLGAYQVTTIADVDSKVGGGPVDMVELVDQVTVEPVETPAAPPAPGAPAASPTAPTPPAP